MVESHDQILQMQRQKYENKILDSEQHDPLYTEIQQVLLRSDWKICEELYKNDKLSIKYLCQMLYQQNEKVAA